MVRVVTLQKDALQREVDKYKRRTNSRNSQGYVFARRGVSSVEPLLFGTTVLHAFFSDNIRAWMEYLKHGELVFALAMLLALP